MAVPIGPPYHNQWPVVAPGFQVWWEADPHVGLAPDDRAVNQYEAPVESAGKHAGIFVLGRQKRPQARESLEVLGNRQRNDRAAFAERDVSYGELLLFFEPDDSGVFEAPSFFPGALVGLEGGVWVDLPVG